MRTVNVSEAKVHLSSLIDEALAGEEIVIARRNRPLVRLQVVPRTGAGPRILGRHEGRVWLSEDFDAPLEQLAGYMP